jgi:hypothetical protein
MKNLLILIVFVSSITVFAQKIMSNKETLQLYSSQLHLSANQFKQFRIIFKKYKTKLNKNTSDAQFNKVNKFRDLEVYEILSKEQYSVYKKVKLEIEPKLKYRFNKKLLQN